MSLLTVLRHPLRRRSLRTKALLLVAPGLVVIGLLAWSAVAPYRGVGAELDRTETSTAEVIAAQRFMVTAAQEGQAAAALVLGAGGPDRVTAAQRASADALRSWKKLAAELDEADGQAAIDLTAIEYAHSRLQDAGRRLVGLVDSGDRARATALVIGTIEPVIDEVLGPQVDGLMGQRQSGLLRSLFRLGAILDRAAPLGFGGPNIEADEVTARLALASFPETFARFGALEVREYLEAVLTGDRRQFEEVAFVDQQVESSLQGLRQFVLAAQDEPARASSEAALARLERGHTRLHEAGERAWALVEAGELDAARMVIEKDLLPALDDDVLVPARLLADDGAVALDAALDDVRGTVDGVGLQLRLLLALVALTVVGIPLLVSRRLVRPLLGVRDAAVAVGRGDLDARTPVRAGGEVGELAEAFETMVTKLRASQTALVAARDEAEQASAAKNEFLSRMSHELRTPLNAILGFGQLLETDEGLTPAQSEDVGHILRAGRHLLDLINEVLDIARIEGGGLALSLEPVGVNDVVSETLDLVGPLAAAERVELPTDLSESCRLHVRADRQRLKQVLLNLLVNAVKYNRPGGSVAVSCEPVGADRMRVSVTDTGPGIPAERADHLFTPFDRLGAEQSDIEGTGLGLALAKRLVEAMEGTIGFTTAPGAGTTFWVDLPRAETPAGPHVEQALARVESHDGDGDGVGRTVLYVEDNLSNLRLVEQILSRRPHVGVLAAMQGTLGLAMARDHRPDAILLDLNLPDMGGMEVLARLREHPHTRDTPVVVISADATPGQVERLLAAGAHRYLTKPFDVREFLEVLDDVLG